MNSEDKSMSKTFSGTARGFGGDITVTISAEDGKLLGICAEGPLETPEIGEKALELLPKAILAAGGTQVDAVSGATVTSTATLQAAEDAMEKAGMISASGPVRMKPGTYNGEGIGYNRYEPIRVRVTVSETAIESVQIDNADTLRETKPIFIPAAKQITERIVARRNLTVDAITGATASCSGIKTAARGAVIKALEAGGSDPSAIRAFCKTDEKSGKTVHISRDIVIAGMGGAGCAAAMSAIEACRALKLNLSVLAIDSAGKYGGTAAVCGEPFAVNAPEHGRHYGYPECDRESIKHDWYDLFTRGQCKEELLDLFFDESGKTIDWLSFEHGFQLHTPLSGFGSSSPWKVKYSYICDFNLESGREYPPDFRAGERAVTVGEYFNRFVGDFTALGGEYMLETECYELLYDKKERRVLGVKARGADGTEYIIHAKRVILAGGGFGGSKEMEIKHLSNDYYPLRGYWPLYGMAQNKGQMLASAIAQGAATYNIGMVPCVHFTLPDGHIDHFPSYERDRFVTFTHNRDIWSANDLPGILGTRKFNMQVGMDGRRHYNEGGLFEFWKCGPYYYGIVGSDYVDQVAEKGIGGAEGEYAKACVGFEGGYPCNRPAPEVYEALEKAIEAGFVFKGETAGELAEKLGMPADALADEIAKYSRFCENGVDEDFGKQKSLLIPCTLRGPYYAVRCRALAYSTIAALDIDTNINVLDTNGNVMVGLYACGNDSGGVLYAPDDAYARYGGVALGWAFTSGRLAGTNAVKSLAKS